MPPSGRSTLCRFRVFPSSPLTILVSQLALAPAVLAADEAPRNANFYELVVTAAGHEQNAVEAPASISVIDREALQQRYFKDVTDALRDIPGIVITGGGSGDRGADITMRGLPADYTLLLVDGKRQSSRESRPNGSAGFEQDWLPPMEAVERIEVVRGPMSTLYGSDAIGGVVNIITRKVPADWHGNIAFDTVVQENDVAGGIVQTNFYVGGPLVADWAGLQVYGQTYSREEDQIINGYEEKDLQSLTARLAFTPSKHHDLIIEAGLTDQHRRAHVGVSAPAEGCRGGCTDSDDEHRRRYYAVTHTGRWGGATSDTYVQQETAENITRQMEIVNTVAKTHISAPLGRHMLTLGANYEKQELEDHTSNRVSDRTYIEGSKWAAFAEDEWSLTDEFSLTFGARLDDDENYGSHVSPRLYGVWRLASQWTLKGGVSTGFRSPDLREITPDWGQVSRGGNVYGNPDLKPETSLNKELGLHYVNNGGPRVGLTIFQNDFDDKITRVVCPVTICTAGPNEFGADPTYRVNVDEAETRGAEFALAVPLTASLKFTSSYTYTESEQKTGEYAGFPLTQLPEHQATAGLNWQLSERLKPWLRASYRSEESQPVQGPSQSTLIAPSYTFVDSGLNIQLKDGVDFKFAVYNLFDERVTYEEYGYVEDGRRFWFGVKIGL